MSLDAVSPAGSLSTLEVAAALWIAAKSIVTGLDFEQLARSPKVLGMFGREVAKVTSTAVEDTGLPWLSALLGAMTSPATIAKDPPLNSIQREQEIVEDISGMLARHADESQTPPIVLLDGMDKLSVSEIEPTLKRILAWDLPLSLVVTVPLSYLFTSAFSRREGELAGVHVVPALAVIQRDLQTDRRSLEWFGDLLRKRGVRELFSRDAIDRLAIMTAGIVRDFVRTARDSVLAALVHGRAQVDLEMATMALDDFSLRMSRPVSTDDLRLLKVVAETGRVVGHPTFLALIDGGQIVEYRNGSNWYAIHPLLRDTVQRFSEELAS
ncbi:MAG: hypothetical protein AB1Z98_25225 [Nannocystaceae bacterium]